MKSKYYSFSSSSIYLSLFHKSINAINVKIFYTNKSNKLDSTFIFRIRGLSLTYAILKLIVFDIGYVIFPIATFVTERKNARIIKQYLMEDFHRPKMYWRNSSVRMKTRIN